MAGMVVIGMKNETSAIGDMHYLQIICMNFLSPILGAVLGNRNEFKVGRIRKQHI